MKRRMTRRRSALCWTALAVALTLLWGVAKGYGFTPGQARERHLGRPTPEAVLVLGKELHPYTTILGGPYYERHVLCVDEEQMLLLEERFELFGSGWQDQLVSRADLKPENAAIFPELTVWATHYYSWSGNGYLYFRVKDMSDDVLGFAAVQGRKGSDGSVTYREYTGDSDIDFTANGELPGAAGWLDRGQLSGDGHGSYYGVVAYYPKSSYYGDYKGYYDWYVRMDLADGRSLYAKCEE